MAVLLLLQLPPVVVSPRLNEEPAQEGTAPVIAAGEGLTVTVKLCAVPVQPLADGVTLITAVTAVDVVFTAVKELIFPVPVEARPILVLLLVQV